MPLFKIAQQEIEEIPEQQKQQNVIYIGGVPHKVLSQSPDGSLIVQNLVTGEVKRHSPGL